MVKSTGGDLSTTMDPVNTGSTKRSADQTTSKDKLSKLKDFTTDGKDNSSNKENLKTIKSKEMGMSMEKVKESLEALFDEDFADLSEDLKEKLTVIFKDSLIEATLTIRQELEEEYENNLREGVVELINKIDEDLEFYSEKWLEENRLAVESGIKIEMAENFLTDISKVISEYNVDIDEEKIDVVAQMAEQIEDLQEELLEREKQIFESNKSTTDSIKNKIVESLTGDLAETEKHRVKRLVEYTSFDDEKTFRNQVANIIETLTDKKPKNNSTILEEDTFDTLDERQEETIVQNPLMKNVLSTISRMNNLR